VEAEGSVNADAAGAAGPETPAEASEMAPVEAPPVTAPAPVAAEVPSSPKRRSRRGLWIALILVFLIAAAGGGGAYYESSQLSAQYSPQRAVLDYFAGMAKGDVPAMMSNATFLRGDGSFDRYFGSDALSAMVALPENKGVSAVQVLSTRAIDDSTAAVKVSMMWGGKSRIHEYTVALDPARVHTFFYHSWRVQIPNATISVTLPNQPGLVQVDGINLPDGADAKSIQVIEGYHSVTMLQTDFYDATSQTAAAVDDNPLVAFESKLTAGALTSAASAVKTAAMLCPSGAHDCIGQTYNSPGQYGYIYFLTGLPGYSEIVYNSYVWTFTSDMTTGMTVTVSSDAGKATAAGTCAMTLTVDGSKTYNFKGDWTATLTWSNGAFVADLVGNCFAAQA